MKIVNFALVTTLLFSSCGKNSNSASYEQIADESTMIPPPPPPAAPGVLELSDGGSESKPFTESEKIVPLQKNQADIKIKKTAYLTFRVNDYKKANEEVKKILKSTKAYLGSENEQNSVYRISNDMLIRVENQSFDELINKLVLVAAHVDSKNISTEDVTVQYIDIEARLKSKRELEKRYLDILNKSTKVSDVLEVEEQLGIIREEIEAKEGELKYLADQVDYSTIHLNVYQNFEYTQVDAPGFWGRLGNAFEGGWHGFLGFVVGVIYAWPFWIISGVLIYIIVKFIKRRVRKTNQ